jgi:hypothetical protein
MRYPNTSKSIKGHLRLAMLATFAPMVEIVLFKSAYTFPLAFALVVSCFRYSCRNCGRSIGELTGSIFKFGDWLKQVDACTNCGNPIFEKR